MQPTNDKRDGMFALVIDDNDYDLENLVASLKGCREFAMVLCRHSAEGIAQYLLGMERQPDIVITDLNMPKVSGFDLLAEMKAEKTLADIPVVMFSSSSWDQDVEKAQSLGAVAFLTKSDTIFGFTQIGKVIRDIMSGTITTFHTILKS